jgi:hypothetical protein
MARPYKKVCGKPSAHRAGCHAEVVTTSSGSAAPLVAFSPTGYGPADLQSAYNLTSAASTQGSTQTIAIVDAYDDPNAESDLAAYRSQFGLSPCTTADGCFRKVDQDGGTDYPAPDGGWGLEISLDLQMASAVCPNCRILLVEAADSYSSSLAAGVDRAAAMGATQISNSYGAPESRGETDWESHYNHPGIDITASSGDDGFGVQFPAASRYVTAVGGTSLARSGGGRGWSESAWSGAGSGCSDYIPKPSWQHDADCARRTVADVSAVADPNTGMAVYDTFSDASGGAGGWVVVGGTSASAPIVAGAYALAGGRSKGTSYGSFSYAFPSAFNDVSSGANGTCLSAYQCNGVSGYDGPTGNGSPNAAAGYAPSSPSISGPADGARTNSSTLTLSGTSDPGSTIEVFNGTVSKGTVTASESGTWAMDLTGLSDGTHSYTAKATDAAGNTSPVSSATTLTIDTVAPSASHITTPQDGFLTNSRSVRVAGTAEAGATVEILDGPASQATTTADDRGTWSTTVIGISDGHHSFTARASDLAGNTSMLSNAVAGLVDTVVPATPAILTPAGASHTKSTLVMLSGTAEPNATVEIFDGMASNGTAHTGASGAWSLTRTGVAIGSHSYTAKATDAAGNASRASAAVAVTVDVPAAPVPTAPPAAPVLDPAHPRVTVMPAGGRGSTLVAGAHGRVTASLANRNPFAISGYASVVSKAKVRVTRTRSAVLRFGHSAFKLATTGSARFAIKLSRTNLALLKRLKRVRIVVAMTLHDRAGHSAKVRAVLTLTAPKTRRR